MNTLSYITLVTSFLIVYHHVLYPVLLSLLVKFSPQRDKQNKQGCHEQNDNSLPYISILIPAYNEEKYIADKIRNLAAQDYPINKFEVVIATDGCTDQTVKEAIRCHRELFCNSLNLRIIEFPVNKGKVSILNALIPQMRHDIVVLSDVSALVSLDALKRIAETFRDSRVGAINGNYRVFSDCNSGEKNYWKYQQKLKTGEQQLGSVLGAHGALYAIRKPLFRKLPNGTINDDFIIPMRILEQGFRVAYNPEVNAVELEANPSSQDWRRRVRIGFGNAQQIFLLRNLFLPKYRGVAFSFFSGKGLRVLMPFLMIFTFVSSWILSDTWYFSLLAYTQTFAYLLVALAHVQKKTLSHPILQSLHYLVLGHLASLCGCIKYLSQRKNLKWS